MASCALPAAQAQKVAECMRARKPCERCRRVRDLRRTDSSHFATGRATRRPQSQRNVSQYGRQGRLCNLTGLPLSPCRCASPTTAYLKAGNHRRSLRGNEDPRTRAEISAVDRLAQPKIAYTMISSPSSGIHRRRYSALRFSSSSRTSSRLVDPGMISQIR